MQRSICNPSVKALTPDQRGAAQWVAERLAAADQRGWLVGGCVRDLALGRQPKDVDLATGALPEEIEAIFPRTIGVGRAFGTLIVPSPQGEVELTTFRSEEGYSDGRRPDQVRYGASLEEDARRRDFTCNALYLDPLSDQLEDPEGGLEHLSQGLLACVGEAGARFDEDGLRLLRLARFAAGLQLEVQPETLAGAKRFAERIAAVSAERKLGELERIAHLSAAQRAIGLLQETGVLGHLLPVEPVDLQALERLPASPGPVLLFGALLGSLARREPQAALEVLEALRPSTQLRRGVADAWELLERLEDALEADGPRSQRIQCLRAPGWKAGAALWRASYAHLQASKLERLEAWCEEREALGPAGLKPEPWLKSADLKRLGLPPGPRWGELLSRAEALQLDGELADREAALAWLARQA